MTSRRSFLIGAASLLAAPAIVRAESLMKLYVPRKPTLQDFTVALMQASFEAQMNSMIYGFGAVEYPVDGLPRSVDPFRIAAGYMGTPGIGIDHIRQAEYDNRFYGLSPLLDLKQKLRA